MSFSAPPLLRPASRLMSSIDVNVAPEPMTTVSAVLARAIELPSAAPARP